MMRLVSGGHTPTGSLSEAGATRNLRGGSAPATTCTMTNTMYYSRRSVKLLFSQKTDCIRYCTGCALLVEHKILEDLAQQTHHGAQVLHKKCRMQHNLTDFPHCQSQATLGRAPRASKMAPKNTQNLIFAVFAVYRSSCAGSVLNALVFTHFEQKLVQNCTVEQQGHPNRIQSLNMAASWPQLEANLLQLGSSLARNWRQYGPDWNNLAPTRPTHVLFWSNIQKLLWSGTSSAKYSC